MRLFRRLERNATVNQKSSSEVVRPAPVAKPSFDPVPKSFRRLGFYYCLVSSLCYTLSFVLVRFLTEGANPDWIFCVKESVPVLISFPIILTMTVRGKYAWPSLRAVVLVLIAGFFNDFIGGRFRIWTFAVLGLVLSNPLIQISTILVSLLLGAFFLRERISIKKWIATVVFIIAVILISASRTGMQSLLKDSFLSRNIGWGISLALLTGVGYALFYVIMRNVAGKKSENEPASIPVTLPMFLVCGIGTLTGGGFFVADESVHAFFTQPATCWIYGLSAGVAEMAAFILLNIGLRYASASKVSMIAVSQLIFLTFLGRFVFHEPTNLLVWIGVALTCVGIFLTADLD